MNGLKKVLRGFIESISKSIKLTIEHYSDSLYIYVVFLVAIIMFIVSFSGVAIDFLLACSILIAFTILLISMILTDLDKLKIILYLITAVSLYYTILNITIAKTIFSGENKSLDMAGDIILGFGKFIIGESYILSAMIFISIVFVSTIFILKYSSKITHNMAYQILANLPSNQMNVDKNLNLKNINQETAKKEHEKIILRANFYTSIDGANMSIKMGTIANIITILLSIIIIILNNLSTDSVTPIYIFLTIGNGLVFQSLFTIVSMAIVLTVKVRKI